MPKEVTQRQKDHMDSILQEAWTEIETKYLAGCKEHGGNIEMKGLLPLVNHAIEEAVDQMVYMLTIRQILTGTEVDDDARTENED